MSSSEKKLTKTKNDEINAIMEKFNLSAPKVKTKKLDNKTNFEVKPTSPAKVIHIKKEEPSIPAVQSVQKNIITIPAKKEPEPEVEKPKPTVTAQDIIKHDEKVKEMKKMEMPKAIVSDPKKGLTKSNIYNIIPTIKAPLPVHNAHTTPKPAQQQVQSQSQHGSAQQAPTKSIRINSGLTPVNDSQQSSKQIIRMPQKLSPQQIAGSRSPVNHNHNPNLNPKNILNVIPTIQNYNQQHPQQQNRTTVSRQNERSSPGPVKQISLDNNYKAEDAPDNKPTIPKKESRPRSPIHNLIARQQLQQQSITTSRDVNMNNSNSNVTNPKTKHIIRVKNPRTNVIKNNTNTNDPNTNNSNTNNPSQRLENISSDPALANLEQQRQLLQEQQKKELMKIRHQKEQITKINNRNKELELMKSIQIEKQRLKLIQQKQAELNNVLQNQLQQSQPQSQQQIQKNINISTTAKQNPNIIYNIEDKKSKKNIPNILNPVNIPASKPPTVVASGGSSKKNIDGIDVLDTQANIQKKDEVKKDEGKKETKETKKKESLEPYKYYTKKDKPELSWPAKSEIYNSEKYENPLDIVLGIQPLYNPKSEKDKKTLEDKKQILSNEFGFTKLDKFKDNTLDAIYKILNYDKIIYCQIHQLPFWHRRNVHIQHLQFPWSFPNCPNGFHIFSKDPLERKYSVEKKIF